MRICILGSVALPVPPLEQGGTEWIVYYQAKELAKRGHQILLIAAEGTKEHFLDTTVTVIEVGKGTMVGESTDTTYTEGSRMLRREMIYLAHVSQLLIDQKNEYDVILNNMRGEAVFLPVAKMLNKPFVTVMHLPLFAELATMFAPYKTPLITISNAQRKGFPDLNYLATVYNCVDTDQYSYNATPDEYLLMIGSIGRHKNQKDAIRLAKETNMQLILAGKIREQDYFEELKKDIDGKQIVYKGEVGSAEKIQLYKNAKAFIFPILWEEPFGLVMIEAMSCGTPVLAYNNGAIAEVVADGKTGFVVDTYEALVKKVQECVVLKRADCRKHIEQHFTIAKMIDGYENALANIV
jgi:glycosyltransferase involved in cell wall biosynthesis